MSSLPIVKRFDVFEDPELSPAWRPLAFSVNQFNLKGMKKTLCDRVIVAVCFVPHATEQPIARVHLLIAP